MVTAQQPMARRPAPRPGRHRATAAALEARTASIVRLIATGATRSAVLEHCAIYWGVSPRSADRLLAAARAQIRADWQVERPALAAELLSALSEMQQEARESGDLATALRCIDATAKLAGLA